jgi:hypothetical protein
MSIKTHYLKNPTCFGHHYMTILSGRHLCLVLRKQPDIPQTDTTDTHTHRQHTATYRTNKWTKQTSGNAVAALSTNGDH